LAHILYINKTHNNKLECTCVYALKINSVGGEATVAVVARNLKYGGNILGFTDLI